MTTKQYTAFQDISGNKYGFNSYMEFATWYFGVSRRVLRACLPNATFKQLEKEATKSAEARRKF
jgi:hypothetical protein